MEMNFYMPTRIVTGRDCVSKNGSLFALYGKKCLIVTGKSSAKSCGALQDVTSTLEKQNIQYKIYDGICQNPTYASCLEASLIAKDFGADFITGIGGGSPLDAAKAVAVLTACKDTSEKALFSMEWDAKPLPIIAVGTTAGTGSEVTPVAVITNSKGLKKSFRDSTTYPIISFGDAKYTLSLSPQFTRSTALDALCHCLEAYFNRTSNHICQSFALKGVEILIEMLKKTAVCDTVSLTEEDREKLYCASIYGGLAISVAGTCFPHGMGYFLSEQYGIPHGNACAVYLPDFINHNVKEAPICAKEFFDALGIDKKELISLVESNLNMPKVTLDEQKLKELLPRFEDNKNLKKCYGDFNVTKAEAVLRKLFI